MAVNLQNETLPLLPLKDIVIFPHMIIPVFISEDLCVNAVEESLSKQRKIILSAFKVENHTKNPEDEESLRCSFPPPFDVYDIGCLSSIMRTRKLPDGRMKVLVQGIEKAKITKLVDVKGYPRVTWETEPDLKNVEQEHEAEAMMRAVQENLEKVVSLGKILSPDILMILEDVNDPARLADLVAANLGLKVEDAQRILAVSNPLKRLQRVHNYLSKEIEVYQMQVRIQSQAKEEIGKMQKEHYLREQIRALKTELGDVDPKEDLDEIWKQAKTSKLSKEAREEVERQLRRLERMHQETSEAALTRTHVETILSLPWGQKTKDFLNLKKVRTALETDHYGLSAVKDRILEFLAVKKLNPKVKSPILCLAGPPGVGKTSLGKSIASAIGRNFSRISLGGVRDEADIRGHRKTYIGAYPGRIIQGIKQAKSTNPLIMLDEIDKLGQDMRGDPASALLEVLDPEQNHNFVDHYLSVPFDLSDVIFVANANSLDRIPLALRDRLEIIQLSGYSEEEKATIATKFLVPKQAKENGIKPKVEISKNALQYIINGYTRESGLRNLEKKISAICRKIARNIAEADEQTPKKGYRITPAKVRKYLGSKIYEGDFIKRERALGLAFGMAYTNYGGEILSFESNMVSGQEKLVVTGKIGEIMQESAQAALSFIRFQHLALGVKPDAFANKEIHIHVPQGAVPKDGPSAGIALVSSLLSLLRHQALRNDICMTGEITIHGKVLPVGGLKEKLLAAQREGLNEIILPAQNKNFVSELDPSLRKRLRFHFISEYRQALPILFAPHSKHKTSPIDIELEQSA